MEITQNKDWQKIKSLIPKPLFEPSVNVYYALHRLRYVGNKVYCPICEKKHSQFVSGSCPSCGSGVRHRIFWLFLLRHTNFFQANLKVLHFAPEHCFFEKIRKLPNIDYLSADIGSPRAMVQIDMTDIQYPDSSFDVIFSNHVLEHVNDDLKAMRELYRIQRENGWSIHLVPINYSNSSTYENPAIVTPEERKKAYGHHDHKRLYGTDYKNRLESAGFNVTVFKSEEFSTENEIFEMGMRKGFEIYLCKKTA